MTKPEVEVVMVESTRAYGSTGLDDIVDLTESDPMRGDYLGRNSWRSWNMAFSIRCPHWETYTDGRHALPSDGEIVSAAAPLPCGCQHFRIRRSKW